MEHCCPILELRQYTLHPHARDTLVRVFDEHFIEGQEQHGMRIVGQFRDLGDPDRFVWIRGFPDMDSRTRALEAFYSGPVWKEHGPVANATMIDHTNVLLLRPVDREAAFRFDPRLRPPPEAGEILERPDVSAGIIVAAIHHLSVPASPAAVAALRGEIRDTVADLGWVLLAELVTEPAQNPFARLPVREGANVFVHFASCSSAEAARPAMATPHVPARLSTIVDAPPEILLLGPTRRSLLRHRPDPTGGRTQET